MPGQQHRCDIRPIAVLCDHSYCEPSLPQARGVRCTLLYPPLPGSHTGLKTTSQPFLKNKRFLRFFWCFVSSKFTGTWVLNSPFVWEVIACTLEPSSWPVSPDLIFLLIDPREGCPTASLWTLTHQRLLPSFQQNSIISCSLYWKILQKCIHVKNENRF